jgi:hypothetical protein
MNITPRFPYWSQGRRFVNRSELTIPMSIDIEWWQHPDQHGSVSRPNGHEILRVLEGYSISRFIGLATLLHCQKNPEHRPEIFRDIHMCGLLDVVYGPYGDRLFAPTLTPVSSGSTIHWMDLNSGFNCLDYIPLRRRI